MKILITGFGPFLDNAENISQKMLQFLKEDPGLSHLDISTQELPVEFSRAFEVFQNCQQKCNPDLVFQLGLAAGRTRIGLEKVGLNWVETRLPDNAGVMPVTGEIFKNEPLALRCQMPWTEYMLKNPCPEVELSFSAGAYVCNDLFYRSLREESRLNNIYLVGFIHLPPESPLLSAARIKEILVNIISWIALNAKSGVR